MAVPFFMIISGFVYANSYVKHNIETFENAYEVKSILNKVIRYTFPFIIVFGVQETILYIDGSAELNILQMVYSFFRGGFGPGSYYYPVMMQFIFYFPILFFIIKKYDFKGLVICGFINFIYEIFKSVYGMNEECYRFLLFRYTLVIAFGCYLAIGNFKKHIKLSVLSMLIGIIYIVLFRYLGLKPLITNYWTKTCFWACLYMIPLSGYIINSKIKNRIIELLGRASYNIFLVQMIYYNSAAWVLYSIVDNRILQLLLNIIVCIFAGIIFYYIEIPITKCLINRINIVVEKMGKE